MSHPPSAKHPYKDPLNTCNQIAQTLTHATTSLFLFLFLLLVHTCSPLQDFFVHTPVSPGASLCRALVGLTAVVTICSPPPYPLSPRIHGPRSKLCAGPLQSSGVRLRCWRPHEANTHRMSAVSRGGVLIRFWIKERRQSCSMQRQKLCFSLLIKAVSIRSPSVSLQWT